MTQTSKTGSGIDARDAVHAALRGSALAAGVAAAYAGLEPGAERDIVLAAFAAFGACQILLYAAGLRTLKTSAKPIFYLAAALGDLVFVGLLLHFSGGRLSPYRPAAYLWTALCSYQFGIRGGIASCPLALGLLAGFELSGDGRPDASAVAIAVTTMVLHGPVLGHLFDVERHARTSAGVEPDPSSAARQRALREQARLIEAAKSSSIEVLAGGVAHEINNPLTGILACVKALQEGTVPDERRADYFEGVLEGIGRIRSATQALVDYSRRRSGPLVSVDVGELVSSTASVLAHQCSEKGVQLSSSLLPEDVLVRSDAGQLRRALLNVILNAVQFAPPGSRVDVSAAREGAEWGISVADSGPGIAPENVGRVCDPFFTTKPDGEGSGLGLAVTAGVLRAQGGRLVIDSVEGRGTTVTLWLPVWQPIGV